MSKCLPSEKRKTHRIRLPHLCLALYSSALSGLSLYYFSSLTLKIHILQNPRVLKVLQESPGSFHLQILKVSKNHSPDTSHRQNCHKMGPGAEVVCRRGWLACA